MRTTPPPNQRLHPTATGGDGERPRVNRDRWPSYEGKTDDPEGERHARGAALQDPSRLFSSSLEGNAGRAIDLREGDTIDEEAFKALVRAAVVLNTSAKG